MKNSAEDLDESLDASVICGNGLPAVLAEANASECDLFLALTSRDYTNLVAASIAKSQMGASKTVARVHAGVQREEWLFDFQGTIRHRLLVQHRAIGCRGTG